MQHATCFELKGAGSGSLSHYTEEVACQAAISTQANLFIDERDDLSIYHGLVETSQRRAASIDLLQALNLSNRLTVMILIAGMCAQQEENLLDEVKTVECLALLKQILSLILDSSIVTKCVDGFSRQATHLIHYKALDHALFSHLERPEIEQLLPGSEVTISDHLSCSTFHHCILAKSCEGISPQSFNVLDSHDFTLHSFDKVSLDDFEAALDH